MPTPQEYMTLIQFVLDDSLLLPRFRRQERHHRLQGHCYVATEALYHLLGGRPSGWHPVRAKDLTGITHWWLEKGTERLDPTIEQYMIPLRGTPVPPYASGVAGGFLTGDTPSRRAQEVIRRVKFRIIGL